MFSHSIDAEYLFHTPQMLDNYLDTISAEIHLPFLERIKDQSGEGHNDLSEETNKVITVIDERETQLKVLINYINLIIEKTQEKILSQVEKIEKQDIELEELREENIRAKEEISILKATLEDGRQRRNTLECFLGEIEQKYDSERVLFNETQQELKALMNAQKDFEIIQSEYEQAQKQIEKLLEQNSEFENIVESLKVENENLKQEKANLETQIESYAKLHEDYEKLESENEQILNNLRIVEEGLLSERKKNESLEEKLEELNGKCGDLEYELEGLRRLPSLLRESLESHTSEESNNLNFKFAQIRAPLTDKVNLTTSLNLDLMGLEGSHEFLHSNSTVSTINSNFAANTGLWQVKDGQVYQSSKKTEAKDDKENSHKMQNSSTMPVPGGKRRDILEEFFSLTTQSVLLNCPNFNDLAGISTTGFYKEIMKQEIPYYKWYKWLEKRFDDYYNEQIAPTKTVNDTKVRRSLIR